MVTEPNTRPSLASAPFRASLMVLLALALFIAFFWGINQYQSYQQTIHDIRYNYEKLYRERAGEELANILKYIDQHRLLAIQSVEDSLRIKVQTAYTIASHIYQVHRKEKALDELQSDVVEILRPIRWNNGKGYYFAGRIGDNIVDLFADDPLLEGQNPLLSPIKAYNSLFQELYQIANKKGAGLYRVQDMEDDSHANFPGMVFIKYFKPFDWYIGAGTSNEIIKLKLQEEALQTIGAIHFGQGGHMLCLAADGTILSHPQSAMIGRSIQDLTNAKGEQYGIRMLQNGLQSLGGGYFLYSTKENCNLINQQHLCLSKAYSAWNWILVVDIPMDAMTEAIADATKKHRTAFIQNGVVFLSLLSLAVLFLLTIAYVHSRKISQDINLFTDFFRKAAHTQLKLRNKDSTFSEFEDLAKLANSMVEDIIQQKHLLRRDELRLDTLLQLGEMQSHTIKEKYDFVLYRIVQITDSNQGYIALVNNTESHCTLCSQIDRQTGQTNLATDGSWPLDQESLVTNCIANKKGTFCNSPADLARWDQYPYQEKVQCRVDAPVTDHDTVVLIAGVCNSSRKYDTADLRQITMLMEGLWLHVQKTCSEIEMSRLERQVIAIGEEERSRIGRDLHDDLGSHLSGVELLSTVLQKKLSAHHMEYAEQLAIIRNLIQDAIEKTRRLSHGLYPVHIIEHGLEAATEELCNEIEKLYSFPCNLHFAKDAEPLDGSILSHIYYIIREAVYNAAKHSQASQVDISIKRPHNKLVVTICDNGLGIDHKQRGKGLGLHIMRYRAKAIGASLDITSDGKNGTLITLQGGNNDYGKESY